MQPRDAWVVVPSFGLRQTLVRADGSDARERDAVPHLQQVSPEGRWALTWETLMAANHERVGLVRTCDAHRFELEDAVWFSGGFVSEARLVVADRGGLLRYDLGDDGARPTRLDEREASDLSAARDGRTVLFARGGHTHRMDVESGVTDDVGPGRPLTIAADGARWLVDRDDGSIVRMGGGAPEPVPLPDATTIRAARFDAEGELLATLRAEAGRSVARLTVDGWRVLAADARLLDVHPSAGWLLVWKSDGVFVSNADGGSPTRVAAPSPARFARAHEPTDGTPLHPVASSPPAPRAAAPRDAEPPRSTTRGWRSRRAPDRRGPPPSAPGLPWRRAAGHAPSTVFVCRWLWPLGEDPLARNEPRWPPGRGRGRELSLGAVRALIAGLSVERRERDAAHDHEFRVETEKSVQATEAMTALKEQIVRAPEAILQALSREGIADAAHALIATGGEDSLRWVVENAAPGALAAPVVLAYEAQASWASAIARERALAEPATLFRMWPLLLDDTHAPPDAVRELVRARLADPRGLDREFLWTVCVEHDLAHARELAQTLDREGSLGRKVQILIRARTEPDRLIP